MGELQKASFGLKLPSTAPTVATTSTEDHFNIARITDVSPT